jgi:hypothetical protein
MSYWMVALTPAALSARNREAMLSNVSFTVGMSLLLSDVERLM